MKGILGFDWTFKLGLNLSRSLSVSYTDAHSSSCGSMNVKELEAEEGHLDLNGPLCKCAVSVSQVTHEGSRLMEDLTPWLRGRERDDPFEMCSL